MNTTINIGNKGNFEKLVLKSDQPVLVDFWAPWCGPCNVVAPIIEELAQDYEGKLQVVKVNTDDEQDIAEQFDITSIPTMIFFINGEEVARTLGAQPKDNFEAIIKEHTNF